MAADSLVARRRAMPAGGWAWRSSIQAPHLPHRPGRRRGVGRRRPPRCLRGHARRSLPARRRGGRRLPARRRGAGRGRAALARLGRSGRARGRRRTSRASTTARPGSAITSGSCARSRRGGGSATAALAGMRWLVAQAQGTVLSGRTLARGAGRTIPPGASRTTGSAWARRASCSRSTRSPTAPAIRRFRAVRPRRRCPAPAADRERHAPAAARLRGRDTRDRLPLRFGRCRVHVPRALRARPRSCRSRHGAPLLRWVNAQAVADRRGRRCTGRSAAAATMPAGFELGAAGIAWVNLRAFRVTGDRALP